MARVPRELFVAPELRARAYDDAALGLSYGQSISQPYIVALTAQWLALRGDERVLDVGAGSGYAAAVLAELGREVVAIELIPELAEGARRNLDAAGYGARVEVRCGDGALGAPDRAPFDAIAVAATAVAVPPALVSQLRLGGRIVIPLGERLALFERAEEGLGALAALPARFVPLVVPGA